MRAPTGCETALVLPPLVRCLVMLCFSVSAIESRAAGGRVMSVVVRRGSLIELLKGKNGKEMRGPVDRRDQFAIPGVADGGLSGFSSPQVMV
jgi:hypothetical protein